LLFLKFFLLTLLLKKKKKTQDVRGQANGIAVTIMSISKAIAPAVAGIM
jgi:hypothetical protein